MKENKIKIKKKYFLLKIIKREYVMNLLLCLKRKISINIVKKFKFLFIRFKTNILLRKHFDVN